MTWLISALSSSIGRKFVMAITGLLLCGFLVAHLAGNVFLYIGPEAYDNYTHKLHEQEFLVKIAEAGLIVLFVAHIWLAIQTTRMNWAARKVSYENKTSKIPRSAPDKALRAENWMFISGVIVLGFLILHLADFTWELRLQGGTDDTPFEKAIRILRNPLSFSVYLIGSIVLGIHLRHGFASAFQSLGINHPRYNAFIEWTGIVFAIVVGVGFASFPLWAMLIWH